MSAPPKPWSDDELADVGKKQLVEFLQTHGNNDFQIKHGLKGTLANVTKKAKKDKLEDAFKDLYVSEAFRTEDDDKAAAEHKAMKEKQAQETADAEAKAQAEAQAAAAAEEKSSKEPKKYTKRTIEKGDKVNFPKKGETVKVRYVGMLEDGTVFDRNDHKKKPPLKIKVGMGQVIRGWDEVLMEMSVGEKVEVKIQPEWAYGEKGIPDVIPKNATLTFEMKLEGLE